MLLVAAPQATLSAFLTEPYLMQGTILVLTGENTKIIRREWIQRSQSTARKRRGATPEADLEVSQEAQELTAAWP